MSDARTMKAYADAAERYAAGFARKKDVDQAEDMAGFLALIPPGGRILDMGCGPGHWAATFRDEGYDVTATDASPEMADVARETFGVDVHVEPFDALEAQAEFHGIWCNFSLLHLPRADFLPHLRRIQRALKSRGALHLGMKIGAGEARDTLGRFYTYYTEEELKERLAEAGFTVTQTRRGNGEGLAGGVETFVILTAHA